MVIAKQVPYDLQNPVWDAGDYPGWEFVGNRDYEKRVSEDYKNWMKFGDEIIYGCTASDSDDLKKAVSYRLNHIIENKSELREWERIVEGEYGECCDSEDTITHVLSLIHHTSYIHTTIRGNCQSEWQDVYLPESEKKWLSGCRSRYFNTGTEWDVYWNEENYKNGESDFNIYVIDTDDPRKAIADACGVSPDEVKLIAFGGYRQVPYWNE